MAQGTTKGVPIDIDGTLANNSDLLVASQKATKTYVDNGLLLKQNVIGYTPVNKGGDTMIGNLILNANPTLPLQAATKDYIDTLINGIDWKQAANAGTVSALPTYAVTGSGQILTGTTNGAIPSATTDGVTLVAGNRVLVKNETSTLTPNNGIYVVTQAGDGSNPFILTRSDDANTPSEISEATLSVNGGSTLSNTQWHCNPAAVPVVIGTTNITFAQIGSGTYTAGSGLTLTGNIFSIPSNGVTDSMIQSATNWNTAYTNRITSLTTTGSSGAATLLSNTLNIPNYTLSGLGGVSSTRTLTINGTAYDLSADRSWSVGTVTSVAALTLGTSGTDLSSTVATGTTTPVITLNVPTASATNRGALSSADWSTFNAKQDAITLTTTGTSGAATLIGATLNIPQYQAVLTNPITGTGAAGQVAYWSGTNTQTGSNNLFWDATNNRLGIGTATPSATLQVKVDTNKELQIYSPLSSVISDVSTLGVGIKLSRPIDGLFNYSIFSYISSSNLRNLAITTRNDFVIATGNDPENATEKIRLKSGGNLLVGTTTDGGQKLQVSGSARIGSTTASAMYWDDTNNRLGIGTASPAYNLHLVSSSTSVGAFRNSAAAIGQILVGNTVSDLAIRILASGDSLIFSDTGKYLAFGSNGATERMRIDSSGNLGLGVTPSAWGTAYKAIQIAQSSFVGATLYSWVANNWVDDGIGNKYIANGFSTLYEQRSGEHRFLTAPSGTAGNAISFTQAMTLDASGRLALGRITADHRLDLQGNALIRNSLGNASFYLAQEGDNSSTLYQYNNSTLRNVFASNGTSYITGGNVLIGTTTDSGERLQVSGTSLITGAATFSSSVTAASFIKSGGTSAQILAADGSVITAGTNITISGGTISASGGGSMAIGGSITSATAGSVLFAGTSGVLQQDNANFFWDDSNNRLGIGTATPTTDLEVSKSANTTISALASTTSSSASVLVKTGAIGALFRAYGSTFSVASLASKAGFGPDGATGLVIFTNSTSASGGTGSLSIRGGGYDTAAECLLVDQTGTTFTKQLKSTVANSTTTGGGQIYLNGATGNRIDYAAVGVAAPAFTTRSAGTKIVLFPGISASAVDFAIGMEGGTTWHSIPEATNVYKFKWYAGITNILSLNGLGTMTLSRNDNLATAFEISNTTSGTTSQVVTTYTSDASSGITYFGKRSSAITAYKTIAIRDAFILNTTGGDISILNDFATGTIKFAAGGSSTAQVTIGTTGLTTFATGVDYKRLNPTTTTTTSTATLTPDISAGDTFTITAQAASLSLANPTGTPVNGQKMIIRIKDNGTARAITFSGTQYRASSDLAFPTTTIVNKTLYMGFIWNSTDSKWDMIALLNNF